MIKSDFKFYFVHLKYTKTFYNFFQFVERIINHLFTREYKPTYKYIQSMLRM